jgi:hypothetical protein
MGSCVTSKLPETLTLWHNLERREVLLISGKEHIYILSTCNELKKPMV